jgi:hypothetical protein
LTIVIQNKGGLEALVKRLEEKQIPANEVGRIAKERAEFGSKGIDASFTKKMTNSDISVVLALLIGQLLYEIIGYRE